MRIGTGSRLTGSTLLGLLALASTALLVGGRMVAAERWRLERRGDRDPDDFERRADRTERPAIRPRASGGTGLWTSAWPVPPTNEGVQPDPVPDLEVEEIGETALDDHAAAGDPMACGEPGLVNGCLGGVSPFGHHRIGVAVDHKVRGRDQVRSARVDDAWGVREGSQLGRRAGGRLRFRCPALRRPDSLLHRGHDVGPCSGRPGRRVRSIGHAVQGECNGECGRGGDDCQEQQNRFGRISANVLYGEPDD
jgi:hypothetical protein